MSRLAKDYMNAVITRPANQALPERFVFTHQLDEQWRWYYQSRPAEAVDALRSEAAHKLAGAILEHCHFFDASCHTRPDPSVSLEITINDRGAYVNSLPGERMQAAEQSRVRTLKEVAAKTPYGFERGKFYE